MVGVRLFAFEDVFVVVVGLDFMGAIERTLQQIGLFAGHFAVPEMVVPRGHRAAGGGHSVVRRRAVLSKGVTGNQ